MAAAVLRYILIFRVSRYPKAISQACPGDADDSDAQQLNESAISAMWSTREDFVSIVVGQLPLLTPLFRRSFWVKAGYTTEKSSSPSSGRRHFGDNNGYELNDGVRAVVTVGGSSQTRRKARDPYSITQTGKGESQEEIIKKNGTDVHKVSNAGDSAVEPQDIGSGGYHDGAGIMVERTVDVRQSYA